MRKKGVPEPVVESPVVELELGGGRVVLIQRIDDVVRITKGHRVKRSVTDSLMLGGTVLLPVDHLSGVFRVVRMLARKKVRVQRRGG